MESVQRRLKARTASRLIGAIGSNDNLLKSRRDPLRPVCRRTTSNANGEGLRDVFRNGEQLRHGTKRFRSIILVKTGNDDTLAQVGKAIAHGCQFQVEELGLINPDNLGLVVQQIHDL